MYQILINLFIFFCFFPYIEIIPLNTDNQPIALVLGTVIVFTHLSLKKKIEKPFNLLVILPLISMVILSLGEVSFASMRSLMNYISLFIIPYAAYISLRKIQEANIAKFLELTIYGYLLVGLVQLFYNPTFLTFLLPRGDSSVTLETGRGVVSLTPEPTFYGFICLLLLILLLLNKHYFSRRRYMLLWIGILFQVFILSRSSATILVLAISLLFYYFYILWRKRRLFTLVFSTALPVVFYSLLLPIIIPYVQTYRIGHLLSLLNENPLLFVFSDSSVNERFNSIYFSLLGFLENFGVPNGFSSYGSYYVSKKFDPSYSMFFPKYMYREGAPTRIMSGVGALFYELGVFAFIFIYIMSYYFNRLLKLNRLFFYIGSLLFLLLLNAFTFTNALVCFVIGFLIFLKKKCDV